MQMRQGRREAQWEAEQRRLREAADLERVQMREQMEMLQQFVGETQRADETRTASDTGSRTPHEGEVKLVQLSDQDDIEAYLTIFERVMRAYEVKEERWAMLVIMRHYRKPYCADMIYQRRRISRDSKQL